MRWRKRKADPEPPRTPGADESLYGPGRERPYLVKVAESARRPGRYVMARRSRILAGSRNLGRSLVLRLSEVGAAACLLRGLWLIWVPLAWIAGALILGALAWILSDEG